MSRSSRSRYRARPLAVAAAIALLPAALALTACGSSSAGSAGGGSGAKGGDVVVMTWAPAGTGTDDRQGVTELAQAIGRDVDSKGGLHGRQLKVLACNERGSADGAAACARQAVDAHVVAVVGAYSQHADSYLPVLEAAGIPYLGGYGLSVSEFSSPFSYPVGGGTPSLIAGSGRQLVAAGCKSVAVLRPDNRSGDALTRYLAAALKPDGVSLTDVKVPDGGADYAAAVRQALDGDHSGNCVTDALSPEQTLKVLDAWKKAGPRRTQLASVIGSIQQSVVDATGGADGPLAGAFATGWYPPETSPLWDGLRSTAAGDKQIATSDLAVQTTWVAYQVLLQAADRLSSAGTPFTARTLRNELDSGDSLETGGVTPPLTWSLTDMLPSAETPRLTDTWVTFQQVKDGRLTQQQNGFVDVRWALTGGKPS
ncbi:ABC transporter substrate-binding protein [Kitasatospora sp. NPDC002227]|uniref:ABC transporter substrate-binding protein n=1 Tax=Kitasatospora sp. NPDC002227 TaxID=3154773 RepID=UPI003323138E